MIDFIRKNKSLKDVFELAEEKYNNKNKASASKIVASEVKSEEIIEEIAAEREFYEVLCEDFCDELIAKDIKYDESLIKINIQFNKGELAYKICFPLIEISETKTQVFVATLKNAIKEHVSADYSVSLCLKKDDETHNVILILERVQSDKKYRETSFREEA